LLTLAVDCALRLINLGLADGEKILGELSCDVGTRQAELLPSAVADFLSLFGYAARDIGLVAVTTGPGYFTGIRVGMSYAAALAESVGALVVSAPTLLAMASSLCEALGAAGSPVAIAPVIMAGKDSVYAAVYGRSGDGITDLFEPSYVGISDFIRVIRSFEVKSPLVITGAALPEELKACGTPAVTPPLSLPSGILRAARSLPPEDPAKIRAVYLREPG
jgi:tRNA threonylcarbamoyladenosine biosynthesis protein TsaB